MRSQDDLDAGSVCDISEHLSEWQFTYIPIYENWDQLDLDQSIKTNCQQNLPVQQTNTS